jgi:hypothetical protein
MRTLKDKLVKMGADHFESIFEDDGWQDLIEEFTGQLGMFDWVVGDESSGEDEERIMLAIERAEQDLVPFICAEIMRRQLSAARLVQTQWDARSTEVKA